MAFKKKFAPRRKFCRFCADADLPLDYKRPDILRDYTRNAARIIAQPYHWHLRQAPAPALHRDQAAPVRWLCCSTPPAIPLT